MEYFFVPYTCKPKIYKQIPTPMTDTNLIEIFCIFDVFCKYFTPELKKHTLQVPGKRHRNRASRMPDSEIMTILVLFHTHRFRDLKSLSGLYLPAYAWRLPTSGFLQPLRRASGTGRTAPAAVSPDMCTGQVFRHIHH